MPLGSAATSSSSVTRMSGRVQHAGARGDGDADGVAEGGAEVSDAQIGARDAHVRGLKEAAPPAAAAALCARARMERAAAAGGGAAPSGAADGGGGGGSHSGRYAHPVTGSAPEAAQFAFRPRLEEQRAQERRLARAHRRAAGALPRAAG